MTEARFARRMDGFDRVPIRPGGPVARVPRITAIVGAKMTSFEQIVGDDYREALASLISEWDRRSRRSSRVCPCSQMDYGHTYNDHDEERSRDRDAYEHRQRELRRRQRELEAGEQT